MCLEKGAGSAAGKWKLGVKANIERITFERAKAAGMQLDGSAGVWPRAVPRRAAPRHAETWAQRDARGGGAGVGRGRAHARLGLVIVGRCHDRRRATILNMCRHLLIFLANRVGAPSPPPVRSGTRHTVLLPSVSHRELGRRVR